MRKPRGAASEKYRVSAHLPEELLVWGDVEAVGEEVVTAGATETLVFTVTLAQPVPAGYTLEIWTHFVSDIGRPQVVAPSEPAYLTCETAVAVTPFALPEAKVHGAGTFFPYRRYAGVRLEETAPSGSAFLFALHDVSMQTYEETLFNLRLAIVDGDDVVGYLGDAFYIVCGATPDHLRVVCPTRVEVGERFDCTIVTCDRFGNKTGADLEGARFDVTFAEGRKALDGGAVVYDATWRHHRIRELALDLEGVVYLRVRMQGIADVVGVSNPIVVRDAWPARVYWGDVHQHTYFADGRGTPAANYEYAISTSCLDFCSVAPHQEMTYGPGLLRVDGAPVQPGWEELQAAAVAYNGAGPGSGLVTILGSEAGSLHSIAGHMNSFYLDPDNRPELERLGLTRENRVGLFPEAEDPAALYLGYLEELERSNGEVLLLPHAHACGGPGKFDLPKRPTYQTNVEICSVHGVFEEFYRQWLAHGHFVGVHGSGDNHMTSTGHGNPGYHYPNTNGLMAAVAPACTRRAIWDAIRTRQTYAVTGNQRVHLDFTINGAAMGTVVQDTASARVIHVEVAGTAPVMRVELIRNNVVVRTYEPPLVRRDYLRLAWTDSWGSRRVDDSLTTGIVSAGGAPLDVVDGLHMYHRTDHVTVGPNGAHVTWRTNGYSGITRGAVLRLVAPGAAPPSLDFQIHDEHLDEVVLAATIEVPLDKRRAVVQRPLDAPARACRPCFTREPSYPAFTLEVDRIDPDWPKVVTLDWADADGSPAFYYVRVEQIDANIAWSSPIWFVASERGAA